MTIAPSYSVMSSPTSDFYHPRRSNNSLNNDIEHVMRLMASASLPQTAHSVDLNNNNNGADKSASLGAWGSRASHVPTDQCLYIQIPKAEGGLF